MRFLADPDESNRGKVPGSCPERRSEPIGLNHYSEGNVLKDAYHTLNITIKLVAICWRKVGTDLIALKNSVIHCAVYVFRIRYHDSYRVTMSLMKHYPTFHNLRKLLLALTSHVVRLDIASRRIHEHSQISVTPAFDIGV